MEEAIRKLIAVDKAAREKVEEAEKKRDSLSLRMAELKKRTIEKAKESFSEQLAEKEKEIRQEISGEISSERILAEDEEIIAEMDRLFDEKSEEWAEEIFLKATQM